MDRPFEVPLEVIDAFVDGEPVDTAALKRALAEAAGRDYLVDAWLIRETVQDEIAQDGLSPPARLPWRSLLSGLSGRPWLAAVAAGIVCLAAGYFAGARFSSGPVPASTLPVTTAVAVPAGGPAAPAPTRVIQVDFVPESTGIGGGH